MKVGIDSYCYHRLFGEVYPHQQAPEKQITLEDFLKRAKELDVDGVSLESCFVPSFEKGYLTEIKAMLDDFALDRVWAWGHPDGLEGGKNTDEFQKMMDSFEQAKNIGAKVMRVVGSSLMFRNEPHQEQIERLIKMFKEAVKKAQDYDIKMAIENHIDFNSDEILEILQGVDSPYMGVNFDTGNFIRVLDDPVKAAQKLAPYIFATHIKDVKLQADVPADTWHFFASAPVGEGLVDVRGVAQALSKANYQGFLAVEIDSLHPDYQGNEDTVVADSIKEIKRITSEL